MTNIFTYIEHSPLQCGLVLLSVHHTTLELLVIFPSSNSRTELLSPANSGVLGAFAKTYHMQNVPLKEYLIFVFTHGFLTVDNIPHHHFQVCDYSTALGCT